jgi:ribonucleoside-diphosphate reductase alpha chain
MTYVTKRDGSKEELNLDKMHKVVFWATEGLTGVSASEVEISSQIQFYNNIKTKDIQETLIKAAADLICEDTPNYQYVAGRMVNYLLRKEVYKRFQPTRLYDLIKENISLGFYDTKLLTEYSEEEWDEINGFVNHERDMSLTYAAMEQMRGKYLVQNRVTGQILETPQVLYILVAASLFSREPKSTRMRWVHDYYEAISRHEISLPTPIMAGVRTPTRQFSSCTLIECGDSLESITATTSAIVKYVSQRAGIGIGAGSIRALGSPVRNGDTSHTGVTPFFKLFQAAVNSCNQGGVRKGSASLFVPFYHLEIETILVLKNNKGVEDNRVRHMDYGVQFNKLFYERVLSGGDITLFSPNDVVEMSEAFFADYDRFKELYETAERNTRIRKKRLKAIDLFSMFTQERKDTGRIYVMNVDNANIHSSFDEKIAPVRMSNLCVEIDLPTTPMGTTKTEIHRVPFADAPAFMLATNIAEKTMRVIETNDEDMTIETTEDLSRIALCTLSAINWGVIRSPADFERIGRLAVRALDNLLDYQEYPIYAARKHTEEYRPLGIGIINFAYFLAKNGVKYSDGSAIELVDEWAEAWSYSLIKASVELAKERGPCKLSQNTKYAKGILPVDTRKISIDELVPHEERMDWETVRADLKVYGIRNSTLMALMPGETSAQICNGTNGIEPPRAYVSIKQSKHGVLKQVVPEFRRLKNRYELLWDQKSPEGYLHLCAILQKYIDMGISVNTSYNPRFYSGGSIPMSELMKHLLISYKFGLKQLYYCNTNDQAGEVNIDTLSHSDDESEDCDACKI